MEGEGLGDIINKIKEVASAKSFKIVANLIRKTIKGARPLKDGEYHFLGANFLGPGTRIDLAAVRNTKPLNAPDAVAKQHDLDYFEASKLEDEGERKDAIREADNKMIRALKEMGKLEGIDEVYRQTGLKGIQFKRKVENVSPSFAKQLLPANLLGQKKGGAKEILVKKKDKLLYNKLINKKNLTRAEIKTLKQIVERSAKVIKGRKIKGGYEGPDAGAGSKRGRRKKGETEEERKKRENARARAAKNNPIKIYEAKVREESIRKKKEEERKIDEWINTLTGEEKEKAINIREEKRYKELGPVQKLNYDYRKREEEKKRQEEGKKRQEEEKKRKKKKKPLLKKVGKVVKNVFFMKGLLGFGMTGGGMKDKIISNSRRFNY